MRVLKFGGYRILGCGVQGLRVLGVLFQLFRDKLKSGWWGVTEVNGL